MNDWLAWFMLGAALFVVVGLRLRPQGQNSTRGSFALAGFMVSMAISRLADPVGALRSALQLSQLILAAAAVWFTLLSFRTGERGGSREKP